MTITDITIPHSLKNAVCIAAALCFARDCACNGSFDVERYGTLAEAWLKELED